MFISDKNRVKSKNPCHFFQKKNVLNQGPCRLKLCYSGTCFSKRWVNFSCIVCQDEQDSDYCTNKKLVEIFLTAILHRGLKNDFFFLQPIYVFPIFIWTFIRFFYWTFIFLFYLDFFISLFSNFLSILFQLSFISFFYSIAVTFWISSKIVSQCKETLGTRISAYLYTMWLDDFLSYFF